MVLVPQSFLEEMQQSNEKNILSLPHPLPYKPEVPAAVKLGQKLDALADGVGDLSPAQRAAMYGQELHRYRTYLQKAKEPSALPSVLKSRPTGRADGEEEEEPPSEELVDQIVASAPKPMRNKAKMMIQHIQRHPDVLSWDEKGRFKYRGKVMPNTNIVDLVSDAVRSQDRKNYKPQGLETFSRALSEINVPRDYVRNPKFIKHLVTIPTPEKLSPPRRIPQPTAFSTPLSSRKVIEARKADDRMDLDEEESGFYDASTSFPSRGNKSLNTTIVPGNRQKKSDMESSWLSFSPRQWLTGKK